MRYFPVTTLLMLSLLYVEICRCSTNETELIAKNQGSKAIAEIGRRLKNFWTWIKQQASSEDTFVGRCAGAFKKMRMAMNFIIFKLGVIVTALAFLSILIFKSLGIGVVLLILSSLGLFAKLFALKHQGGGYESPHGSAVHLHIHNKGGHDDGHYHSHSYPPDWYDRYDSSIARTPAERSAIADLYKRIGLSIDSSDSLYARGITIR